MKTKAVIGFALLAINPLVGAQTEEAGAFEYMSAFGTIGIALFLVFLLILAVLLPLFVWRIKVWTKRSHEQLVLINAQVHAMAQAGDKTAGTLEKLVLDLTSFTEPS